MDSVQVGEGDIDTDYDRLLKAHMADFDKRVDEWVTKYNQECAKIAEDKKVILERNKEIDQLLADVNRREAAVDKVFDAVKDFQNYKSIDIPALLAEVSELREHNEYLLSVVKELKGSGEKAWGYLGDDWNNGNG